MRRRALPCRGRGIMVTSLTLDAHPRRGEAMPPPAPIPARPAIRERWRGGRSALRIAHDLGLPARVARPPIARSRPGDDASSGTTSRAGPAARPPRPKAVRDATIGLRRGHPRRGPHRVASHPAGSRRGCRRLDPGPATLAAPGGPGRAPAGRPGRGVYVRSAAPREAWRADARGHPAVTRGEAGRPTSIHPFSASLPHVPGPKVAGLPVRFDSRSTRFVLLALHDIMGGRARTPRMRRSRRRDLRLSHEGRIDGDPGAGTRWSLDRTATVCWTLLLEARCDQGDRSHRSSGNCWFEFSANLMLLAGIARRSLGLFVPPRNVGRTEGMMR